MSILSSSPSRFQRAGAVLALAVAVAVSGCSSAAPTDVADTDVELNEEAIALLPESIVSAGKISMVSDFAYPPYALQEDDGSLGGSDYEMMNAIAERLGLTPEWAISKGFSTLIPAVQNGRAQVAVESIALTAERLETLNMVSYQNSVDHVIVSAGNPSDVDPTNICGVHFAAQSGTFEENAMIEFSEACVEAGFEEIKISSFSDSRSALQSVVSGQTEGYIEGSGPAKIDAELSNGSLEVLGLVTELDGETPLVSFVTAIALPKTEEGEALGRAIEKVLADMQADGSYDELLQKWGLETYPAKLYTSPEQIEE